MALALFGFNTLAGWTRRPAARAVAILSVLAVAPLTPPAAAKTTVARPFQVTASVAGNYLAAMSAGAQRDTAAAATYFREVLRSDPRNPELLERTFVAALANGDISTSFGLADRLIARDKTNGLAHLVLGVKAIKAKQWSSARAELGKSGNNRQRDITATLLTAWTYVGGGDFKKALEGVDRLRQPQFNGFRDFHAALIADLAKNSAEAAKRMPVAYQADKQMLRIVDAYARWLSRNGQMDEARKVYEDFDQLIPRHPLVTAALADLAAGKQLPSNVKTAAQGAAEVLYGLGAAGNSQGDELAAMIYLRLSLYLEPENALGIVTLAGLYENIKQGEIAIDIYETMPSKSPLRANADIQIGSVLEGLGKSEEALKHLSAIVKNHPNDVDALNALGNLQRSRKEFVDAAATYSKVIDNSPKQDRGLWPVYYFRAISYERQKKWPEAEADFKKALDLFPNQPLVLNYLGYSWVDRGMNLDEAFKMLKKAVELRPTDGYIVDSLGWAHYRLGDYQQAMREIERAVELKPSDATINDHLGDIYWKIGRKLEATFQWNHARDLNPEPEDLPKILEKIKSGLPEDEKAPSAEVEQTKSGG